MRLRHHYLRLNYPILLPEFVPHIFIKQLEIKDSFDTDDAAVFPAGIERQILPERA